MMPEIDGLEVVRRLRGSPRNRGAYVILLTSRDSRSDVVQGLEAGADDYITKPFNPPELRARVEVDVRVLGLQQVLAARVHDLEDALSRVKRLQGLLPICSNCKQIRDDQNYWRRSTNTSASTPKPRSATVSVPNATPGRFLQFSDLNQLAHTP